MAPSSSSPPSPLRKLLTTDPKPKPVAAPLNSASSSSATTVPPPEKRTRDQPNLSDCHGCGRRINHTNPKDRLQPLDSIWRIVLLCWKCRKKVNSGQACPYCFKETEHSGNLFRCCVCQRKIHKHCAGEYRTCAPFCYLGLDLGFRVCVDCWVPDSLKNSVRTCGRSENKDGSKHKSEAKDSSENTVKDANGHVEKVKMSVNDKDQALKKATVAKNTANNAKHILEFVRKEDRDEPRDAGSEIERNNWTDKKSWYSDSDELGVGPLMYRREKKRKTWQEIRSIDSTLPEQMKFRLQLKDSGTGKPIEWDGDIWEILVCVSSDQSIPCININRFGQDPVVYKRNRFIQKAYEGNGMVECSSFDNRRTTFESQSHQSDDITRELPLVEASLPQTDDTTHELPLVEAGTVCVARCNTEVNLPRTDDIIYELPLVESGTVCVARCNTEESLPIGDCNAENDRYFLKYTRTDRGFKRGDKVILPDGSCNAENHRYLVKYCKRIKCAKSGLTGPVSDTFQSAKQVYAPCLNDLQAGYSEKCDGELSLPHGGNDEEPDRYFFKYVKRTKGSHSVSVVEANLHSDTELRTVNLHQ